MRFPTPARAVAFGLCLIPTLLLGACDGAPGGDTDGDATPADAAQEAAAVDQTRQQTNAPDLDVCGLLDTDALIGAMPPTDYNPITARSDDGIFGPVCRFSGGKGGQNLSARVEASSMSVRDVLATYQDAAELPEVGAGVRHYVNPNNTDQRSYVFEARGLTFKVVTMYDGEQASRDFARQAAAMLRG